MAVIDLRGERGSNIALIGKSIGKVIRSIKGPDAADRRAFLGRVLGDPELLEKFGSIARDSPTALPRFLKDEDIEMLQSTLPTLAELQEDIERPGLTPEPAGGTLTPETAASLGEFARAKTVGAKPSEVALEPKRVTAAGEISQEDVTAGLRRDVTGLTPGGKAQDVLVADLFKTAKDIVDELPVEEKEKIALRAAIPSALLKGDRVQAQKDRVIIAQMQIDAQTLDRANERLEASQRSIGARWTERTKTGTPETWQLFFFTQEMNDRAKGLAGGTILPQNQTDIRLMEVAQAFARADQVDKITEEAGVRTQIGILISRIEKKDSEGKFDLQRTVREALLNQLNDAFVELTNLTDGRIPLSIGDIKERGPVLSVFGEGNQPLKIIDEAGNEVDFSAELPPAPAEQPSGVQGDIGLLNFETVDVSKLPEKTRSNLVAIMTGEGTFEELQAFDPTSAQLILDARRNR